LLLFSRKQRAQRRVLNLNSVVVEVAKLLQSLLGEPFAIDLELDPDLPAVSADEGMMQQILMNLAVNSRDAMPRGGRISIATRPRRVDARYARKQRDARTGEFVCLAVSDTGTGMNAETLAHIFEPFFTTKEVGKGTGLGLATVYGIVKQHHGWIEVDTREGEGTTFRIYLPASEQPAADLAGVKAPQGFPRGSETILVVEDEQPLRELVKEILLHCGYKVIEAAGGGEAIEVWHRHKEEIDLLLTDIMMPEGMSGRDLADQILAEQPATRVLYTSGYPVEVIGADLIRSGQFLQKPYHPATLAQAVRDCLDAAPQAPLACATPAGT
jgi:CheY-like chemotaxis protein